MSADVENVQIDGSTQPMDVLYRRYLEMMTRASLETDITIQKRARRFAQRLWNAWVAGDDFLTRLDTEDMYGG